MTAIARIIEDCYATLLCPTFIRSFLVDKLTIILHEDQGRLYLMVRNLNEAPYLGLDNNLFTIQIRPNTRSRSYVTFLNARIFSDGTIFESTEDTNTIVYEAGFTYTRSDFTSSFRPEDYVKEISLNWNEDGF